MLKKTFNYCIAAAFSFLTTSGAFAQDANIQGGELSAASVGSVQTTATIAPIATPAPTPEVSKLTGEIKKNAGFFISAANAASSFGSPSSLSNAAQIQGTLTGAYKYFRGEAIDGVRSLAVLSAAQTPEFIDGVKMIAGFQGVNQFIIDLRNSPEKVKKIPGYDKAAANSVLYHDAQFKKFTEGHDNILAASYALQKEKWALVASQPAVLLEGTNKSWTGAAEGVDISLSDLPKAEKSDIMPNDKFIAAAALLILGEEEHAIAIIGRNSGGQCAYDAFLNTRMCVAATKFAFEHSFCIAKHEIDDFAKCAKNAMGK
jgi:hypothetical protein